MKKKLFEQPQICVVLFAAGDVIATSGLDGGSFNPLSEGGDGNGD